MVDSASTRLRVLEPGAFLNTVRTAAKAAGLHLVVSKRADWDILWTYKPPWENETLKPMLRRGAGLKHDPPQVVINHIPGTLRIASKAYLPAFVRGAGLGFVIPQSYLLPEDTQALLRDLTLHGGVRDAMGWPRWLFKAKNHRGVRVLTDGSPASLAQNSPAIVQERVKPLLLRRLRRAFDVGLYVLVTSVRPLRVYAYDLSLVRFCEVEYPRTPSDFSTDPRSFVISHYSPIWSLPFFSASLKACNDSAACALRAELRADGHDGDLIFERMRTLAVRLLQALEPHLLAGMRRTRVANEAIFELFRFDFLVNEQAQPVLTEVNISPNLVPAYPQDKLVKAALVRDLLQIVRQRFNWVSDSRVQGSSPLPPGIVCEPHPPQCCRLMDHLLDRFNASTSPCLSPEELRLMRLTAAEEHAAAAGGWRRVRAEQGGSWGKETPKSR